MNAVIESEWNTYSENLVEVYRLRDRISLFGGLSNEQLEHVAQGASVVNVSPGSCIFKQGEQPSEIYVVLRGRVVETVQRSGGTGLRADYKEGDCFGEAAVIGIVPQAGEAIAQTHTKLLVVSRASLMSIANGAPELFSLLMMNVARDVSRRLHSVLLESSNS